MLPPYPPPEPLLGSLPSPAARRNPPRPEELLPPPLPLPAHVGSRHTAASCCPWMQAAFPQTPKNCERKAEARVGEVSPRMRRPEGLRAKPTLCVDAIMRSP